MFLLFAVIAFIGMKNIYTSIILLIAGIMELIDTVPKIVRWFHASR